MKQVASLRAELRLWQATLDHQIASIDRRLRGVEEAAAAAATEAQIVSRQMSDQIHHQSEGVPLHPAAADH